MTPYWALIDDKVGCGQLIVDQETGLIIWGPPYFMSLVGLKLSNLPRRIKITIQTPLTQGDRIAYQLK